MKIWLPVLVLGLSSRAMAAPLSGRLAFLARGVAQVQTLGGTTRTLPQSRGAQVVSLGPNGTAIYYVEPRGGLDKAPVAQRYLRGFLSRAPYRTARALPRLPREEGAAAPQISWTGDGKIALLAGYESSTLLTISSLATRTIKAYSAGISRDGSVLSYATETEVRVRFLKTGREKTLFSIRRPQPLFEALKRAKSPKNVAEIAKIITPEYYKESRNWAFGAPTPDTNGRTIFFACNAGTTSGASGNTQFVLFAADTLTGKISVLSKLGTFFGRVPSEMLVSPDNRRLLLSVSAHSSAVQNPSSLMSIDLHTQQARTLLEPTQGKLDSNFIGGMAWSPDSRTVAVSALFYDSEKAMQQLASDNEVLSRDEQYTLLLRDAATGRILKTLHGTSPSWSR